MLFKIHKLVRISSEDKQVGTRYRVRVSRTDDINMAFPSTLRIRNVHWIEFKCKVILLKNVIKYATQLDITINNKKRFPPNTLEI